MDFVCGAPARRHCLLKSPEEVRPVRRRKALVFYFFGVDLNGDATLTANGDLHIACRARVLVVHEVKLLGILVFNFSLNRVGVPRIASAAAVLDVHRHRRIHVAYSLRHGAFRTTHLDFLVINAHI